MNCYFKNVYYSIIIIINIIVVVVVVDRVNTNFLLYQNLECALGITNFVYYFVISDNAVNVNIIFTHLRLRSLRHRYFTLISIS